MINFDEELQRLRGPQINFDEELQALRAPSAPARTGPYGNIYNVTTTTSLGRPPQYAFRPRTPQTPGTFEQTARAVQVATDPVSAFTRGAARGFLAPARMAPQPEESRVSQYAEFAGELAGGFTSPLAAGLFKTVEAIAPRVLTPFVSRMVQNAGVGAVYSTLDAIISRHDELMKLPPRDAAAEVLKSAGVGAGGFAAFGAATEGLIAVLQRAGPKAFSAVRAARDFLHPQGGEQVTVPGRTPSIGELVASERGAVKLPDVEASIKKAVAELDSIYTGVHAQFQPAQAPGVKELPFTETRTQLLGQRNVYSLRSQMFWDRTVTPQLQKFAKQAGDKDEKVLQNAIALYLDRLHDPKAFDADIQAGMKNFPEIKPIVDRMNRLTEGEKQYAEQVINAWDQRRAQFRMDNEIMSQALDFHVSHVWQRTPGGLEVSPLRGQFGASQLSPSSRFSRERTLPTFASGLAKGLKPVTLDIVAINKLNDLDTARAVMAKGIREALKTDGVGKWSLKAVEDWVDFGAQMRMFRQPIELKGETASTMAELHFYVEPKVAQSLRWLTERDPFKFGSESLSGAVLDRLLKYNTYVKGMELSYSFFHDFNLGKVFTFSRPLLAIQLQFAEMFRGGGPGLYRKIGPIAYGMRALEDMTPTLTKLVEHGLVVGKDNIFDAYYALTGAEQKWGLSNAFVKARSRALWETLQPGLKAADAIVTAQDGLKKFSRLMNPKTGTPWTEDQIFEGVAEVMNRKYGGLNWDKMGTTQMQKRLMRAIILAPDWTFSNLMLGVSAFKGGFHPTMWQTMGSNTVEGWAARQSLAKTTASFFATLQGVNYLLNGHFTWDNEEGRWWSIQLPWKASDGRRMYADWLLPGELKDLLRISASLVSGDVEAARKFGAGKLAPLTRFGLSLAGGRDWLGRPIAEPGMTKGEVAGSYASEVAKTMAPIPIGLSAAWQYLTGQMDPTQAVSQVVGGGAVSRGVLVPASEWQSLPVTNKREFLDSLPEALRDEFLVQLRSGRIVGDAGARFREYVDRYRYLSRQQRQDLPPEERYLPPGVRRPREPIPVKP